MSRLSKVSTTIPQALVPAGESVLIDVRGVCKAFGEQRVLDEIDLVISNGVIIGLIGPSGCGKTTLIRILTGVARPTAGEVRVFGTDPVEFSARHRRRFGYMPQLPVLFPNLSVWGNLGFIASVYGIPRRHRRRRSHRCWSSSTSPRTGTSGSPSARAACSAG